MSFKDAIGVDKTHFNHMGYDGDTFFEVNPKDSLGFVVVCFSSVS